MSKNELNFIAETHEYFLGLKRLPSVSEIMKPLTEVAMSKVPPWRLEEARNRGTGVHEAREDYSKFGVEDEGFEEYVDQCKKMMIEYKLIVMNCELRLTNGEFCGTLDLIVQDENGLLHIIDTKTSYAIAPYVPIQLGAYSILTSYNGIDISRCYVFHVKPDTYSLVKKTPDFEQWKELYEIWKNKSDQHTD